MVRSRETLELLMNCGIFTIENVIDIRPFTHYSYLRETAYLGGCLHPSFGLRLEILGTLTYATLGSLFNLPHYLKIPV